MPNLRWITFFVLSVGCGVFSAEPEKKPEKVEIADPNPPAFKIMTGGACPSDYAPRGRSCVHVRAERELGAQRLARDLLAYEQGAAPPRLGPQGVMAPEPPALAEDKDPSKLAPDALSTGQTIDAKEAEQKRLRELQQMIDATRARTGAPTPPPSSAATTQPVPANMEGLNVEVELDGKKRSMSASEWVKQQRSNQ